VDIMVNRPKQGQRSWSLLVYVAVLFTLGTITFAGDVKYDQTTWVDGRNLPGGPDALIMNHDESNIGRIVVTSCMIMRWVADGLLVYRCFVVWSTERFCYYIMALPVLTFLANIAIGIVMLIGTWQSALFSGITFTIPDFSISVAINVLVTLLIVGRLLVTRRQIKAALGPEHSKIFTSIAAMLIESAALFSVTGLIFIVAFARQSKVQDLILPSLGLVQGIAPMLIILRVAQGRAWSNELSSAIEFASQSQRSAPTSTTFSSRDGPHLDESCFSLHLSTPLKKSERSEALASFPR